MLSKFAGEICNNFTLLMIMYYMNVGGVIRCQTRCIKALKNMNMMLNAVKHIL